MKSLGTLIVLSIWGMFVCVWGHAGQSSRYPAASGSADASWQAYNQASIRLVSREKGPEVVPVFETFEVDWSRHFADPCTLHIIKQGDGRGTLGHNNTSRTFDTALGAFRVVSCYGRQSTDPHSRGYGSTRYDMICLPSGQWLRGYPVNSLELRHAFTRDGRTFLVLRHHIFRMFPNGNIRCVVWFKGEGTKWWPVIRANPNHPQGFLTGRYYDVHKGQDEKTFGGLLRLTDAGHWEFYAYTGQDEFELEEGDEKTDGELTLTVWDRSADPPRRQISFSSQTGTFKETK